MRGKNERRYNIEIDGEKYSYTINQDGEGIIAECWGNGNVPFNPPVVITNRHLDENFLLKLRMAIKVAFEENKKKYR